MTRHIRPFVRFQDDPYTSPFTNIGLLYAKINVFGEIILHDTYKPLQPTVDDTYIHYTLLDTVTYSTYFTDIVVKEGHKPVNFKTTISREGENLIVVYSVENALARLYTVHQKFLEGEYTFFPVLFHVGYVVTSNENASREAYILVKKITLPKPEDVRTIVNLLIKTTLYLNNTDILYNHNDMQQSIKALERVYAMIYNSVKNIREEVHDESFYDQYY